MSTIRFRVAIMDGAVPYARLYLSFRKGRWEAYFTLAEEVVDAAGLVAALATEITRTTVPELGRFRTINILSGPYTSRGEKYMAVYSVWPWEELSQLR